MDTFKIIARECLILLGCFVAGLLCMLIVDIVPGEAPYYRYKYFFGEKSYEVLWDERIDPQDTEEKRQVFLFFKEEFPEDFARYGDDYFRSQDFKVHYVGEAYSERGALKQMGKTFILFFFPFLYCVYLFIRAIVWVIETGRKGQMKAKKILLCVLCAAGMAVSLAAGSVSLVTAQEGGEQSLERLSELWKKANADQAVVSDEEKAELEQLLRVVLPDEAAFGADKTWQVTYHDMKGEGSDFFAVKLTDADDAFTQYFWFHIFYKNTKPSSYGTGEAFGAYPAMRMKDAHCFVLVGNVEIRAVASADEYKSDAAIDAMLSAFKLKEIERF